MSLGRALGASTGVVLAGLRYGVDGNIWGAYLATGLWFIGETFTPLEYVLIWPGIPAALATIGYNIGAKMKSDKSKPAALGWYLPLVALRF